LKLENRQHIETLAEKLWQIATCSEKYWLGSAWWYI